MNRIIYIKWWTVTSIPFYLVVFSPPNWGCPCGGLLLQHQHPLCWRSWREGPCQFIPSKQNRNTLGEGEGCHKGNKKLLLCYTVFLELKCYTTIYLHIETSDGHVVRWPRLWARAHGIVSRCFLKFYPRWELYVSERYVLVVNYMNGSL